MLNPFPSGAVPLPQPSNAALSPLAVVSRLLADQGFPKPKPRDVAAQAPTQATGTPRHSVDRVTTAKPTPVADVPAIPAFAYLFHEEAVLLPATSKLVLFLPQGDACPQPVRVVERSASKVKWYAIESWHSNVQRWVDRDVSPKKVDAIEKARGMAWLVGEEAIEAG